jgi:hypothetical protein
MHPRVFPWMVVLVVGIGLGWTMNAMSFQSATAPVAEAQKPAEGTASESPLMTLDWLEGSWTGEAGENRIEFDCRFTQNNAFLVRSFRVSQATEVRMSGMQVVAWDPQRESLRSWTFDSDGGFGEEHWSQTGDRYAIRSKYVLPDGGSGAALNAMSYIDTDTFAWKSMHREIDGELLPDGEPLVFHRVAEGSAEEATTIPGGTK